MTFSHLPAAKKSQKWGSCGVIKVFLTLWQLQLLKGFFYYNLSIESDTSADKVFFKRESIWTISSKGLIFNLDVWNEDTLGISGLIRGSDWQNSTCGKVYLGISFKGKLASPLWFSFSINFCCRHSQSFTGSIWCARATDSQQKVKGKQKDVDETIHDSLLKPIKSLKLDKF